MATAAEPGWYDDGTGAQRWWDGARWTEHHVDLSSPEVELHIDAVAPASAPAAAGWFDDGRGRQRWWDGTRWTDAARFSGQEQSFAGVVVDGRWMHFGALSQPVAGAKATLVGGAELIKRGRLSKPAVARALFGPAGPITPRLLKRAVDPQSGYLVVEVAGQVWLATVPPSRDAEAGQFATWIDAASQHYLYR